MGTSIRVARINHVIVPVAPHGEPEISLVFLFNVIFVVADVLKAFSPMLATLAGIDTSVSCVSLKHSSGISEIPFSIDIVFNFVFPEKTAASERTTSFSK